MSEVALPLGVVSFDGRVLELFGFGDQDSRRVHLAQIRGIDSTGGLLSVDVQRGGVGLKVALPLSDDDRSALDSLVGEVRDAIGREGA